MPWIIPTIDDVEAGKMSRLIDQAREVADKRQLPDPVDAVLSEAVDQLRDMIGFRTPALLDARPGSVPASLRRELLDHVYFVLSGIIDREPTERESDTESRYQKRLEQLRDGDWPIDAPEVATPSTTQASAAGIEVVSGSPRQITRKSLSRL